MMPGSRVASAGPCGPAGFGQLGPFLFPASSLPPPISFLSAILSSPLSQPCGPSLWPVLLASKLLLGPVSLGLLGGVGQGPAQPVALQNIGVGQEEQLLGLLSLC